MRNEEIIKLIENDSWMMDILRTVKTLALPDWWIGAGFVRSKVWDTLHGYKEKTPLPDIDVIYFDSSDFTKNETDKFSTKSENRYQNILKKKRPEINWSVTNQARMHVFHKHMPYRSSEEGLFHWVETATCVGVKLDTSGKIILTAPRGIDDLVNLILRPTPEYMQGRKTFIERVEKKQWLKKWPKLRIVTDGM